MKTTALALLLLAACSTPPKSSLAPLDHHAQSKAPPAASKDDGHAHAPPMSNMTSYWLVLLRKTNVAATMPKDKVSECMAGHMANIQSMAKSEHLVAAGPFYTDGALPDYAGLFLIHTDTLAEAQAMVGADPSIAAGIFVPEYREWWGGLDLFDAARARVAAKPSAATPAPSK